MRELVLHCTVDQAESWSDTLLQAGALSVTVEDAEADTPAEAALFGEPGTEPDVQAWSRSRLTALLADGDDPELLLAHLGVPPAEMHWFTRPVPDADWVRVTQAQFGPIVVDGRIWIIPSWCRDDADFPAHEAQDGTVRLALDPGLAFGTGSHATTHLCLSWLAQHLRADECVLDYGCGSGILAVAARLLGSGPVDAVDIDDQAVSSTRQNAAANGVTVQACLPDALPPGRCYQVVLANILAGPLEALAASLAGRLRPGGSLVLSGILEPQAEALIRCYASWLPLQVWAVRDGWVCLTGRKPWT